MKPIAEIHVRPEGRYKVTVRRAIAMPDGTTEPGEITRETPWFDNLITNSGLDLLVTANFMNACHAGTGTTTPANGNTTLQAFVAGTTTIVSTTSSTTASAPYYARVERVYQFAPGAATGNIAEVGVAGTATSTGPLFSRALILDGDGDPTTITVLSDEYLQVSYELRLYVPTDDVTGTLTIAGVETDITLRAANCTSALSWAVPTSGAAGIAGGGTANDFTGAISADATGHPAGSANMANVNVLANAAYVPGDYHQDIKFTHPINNAAATIRSFMFKTLLGQYQFEVDPTLAITNTQQMVSVVRISWARGSETP